MSDPIAGAQQSLAPGKTITIALADRAAAE
jgi:hypothetical protein